MTPDWKTAYPTRFYAAYDTTAAQPAPVTGWFDMAIYSDLSGFPAAAEMIPLTADQWASASRQASGVQNGAIVAYTPPAVVVPLKTQAQNALTTAATATWQAYGMYGDATPADVVTYLTALRAIANGTDTTSTALPAQPTDVMTASTAASTT